MKAILITFHGDFNSENHEEDTLSAIVGCLVDRTNANAETVTVSTFSDKEVHKMIVANNPTFKLKPPMEISYTQRFCNAFIDVVGSPVLNSEETLKKHFTAALVEGKFTPVRDALSYVSKINANAEYADDRRILSKFRLGFIPKYLNDINNIIKVF